MKNIKILKAYTIDFLKTLEKELKLSICIDRIYFNQKFTQKISRRASNIIMGYENSSIDNETIIINSSGQKLKDLQHFITWLKSQNNTNKKINKAIKEFEKVVKVYRDFFGATKEIIVNIDKVNLKDIISKFEDILK